MHAWAADSLVTIYIQFSAKAFDLKIEVSDEATTASPHLSDTYDYSGGDNRREVNMVLITMHGLHGNIGHYERACRCEVGHIQGIEQLKA